jgi:hypothetical protein
MLRNIEPIIGARAAESFGMKSKEMWQRWFDSDLNIWNLPKISRFYYAGYNIRRAVILQFNGSFTTDSSDHKNVNPLPTPAATSNSSICGQVKFPQGE